MCGPSVNYAKMKRGLENMRSWYLQVADRAWKMRTGMAIDAFYERMERERKQAFDAWKSQGLEERVR